MSRPCPPGPWPCPDDIVIDLDTMRAGSGDRRCLTCDRLLDPASYVGYMHNRRYCSGRCRRRAQRDREATRCGPPRPPTPEQIEAVLAEMQSALDAWEAFLP